MVTATIPLPRISVGSPVRALGFVLHMRSCTLLLHTGFAGAGVGALAYGLAAGTGSGCGPHRPPTKPPRRDAEPGQGGPSSPARRHRAQQPKQPKPNPMPQRFPGYSEGGNDNCLIEICERPANTITKTLFKTPPQAPSAVITDYWRSHCVGARSSCLAHPENWDNISLPKTRSDISPVAGTISESCLEAVPAPQPLLPHGLAAYETTGSAAQLRSPPQ